MKKCFRNGKIFFVAGKLNEEVPYDVSSNELHVCFDGKGGITNYTVSDRSGSCVRRTVLNAFADGRKLDAFCEKRVELAGRMQKILLKDGAVGIKILQFVAPTENAVFYEFTANKPGDYEFVLDFSRAQYGVHYDTDVETRYIAENNAIHLRTRRSALLVFSYVSEKYCAALLSRFAAYKKQVVDEFKSVKIPASAKSEKERALYVSSVFCALENYREIGLFKGFSASGHREIPVRTYFRDSYWTVLSMYKTRPDLVRCQILTLARGIKENGDCPSGVLVDFNPRVRNYYDSPCFFVLMVYDYINRTGDRSILSETVNGKSVYDLCLLAVDRLSTFEDKTGLIVKSGRYNKLDWADQINRTGYVTYVELLYARALYCLSRIVGTRDKTRARRYREMYQQTKNAINTLLWDNEKGYYINYRDGDFVEDNLSVDTILAVLFGISDDAATARLLDNVSALLETRNNDSQKGGDYGVMCVYPFYRGADRCYNRSAEDYACQNGGVWPFWSALVAYAQKRNGRDCSYALTSSFGWSVKHGYYTPIEHYSPLGSVGAPLYAASGVAAWVYDWQDRDFFKENESVW
ncbi:MAG: hypothetical protein J6Z13_05730 [Clostridia bacterium]|nr:hypothetical protein [Clostridia bacterium]